MPPGWQMGPNGEVVSPDGSQVLPPGTTFDAAGNPVPPGGFTGFPVLSTLAGAVGGKMLAPSSEKATTYMVAGAILGYWTKILEG